MSMGLESARKPVAIVLYFFASLGGLLCAMALVVAKSNIERNAATGDHTGASLLLSFMLIGILPLTLVALILALWLVPPSGKRWRRETPDSAHDTDATAPPLASEVRPWLAAGLLVAAAALVVVVGMMLASILRSAQLHYGQHGSDLARLALADLLMFSPILLLAGVLGGIGGTMLRRGRKSE